MQINIGLFSFLLSVIALSQSDFDLNNFKETNSQVLIQFDNSLNFDFLQKSNFTKEEKGQIVFDLLSKQADKEQKRVIDYLNMNNISFVSMVLTNTIRTNLSITDIEFISKFDEAFVFKDALNLEVEKLSTGERPSYKSGQLSWAVEKVNAHKVWEMGFNGQDIVIGMIDTGVDDTNEYLMSSYRGVVDSQLVSHEYNWFDGVNGFNPLETDTTLTEQDTPCGFRSPVPCEDFVHGTTVMSVAVGQTSTDCVGIAPGSKWIASRALERGVGFSGAYLECLDWNLAPRDSLNENPDPLKAADIINNSWGCRDVVGCDSLVSSLMEVAVNNLTNAGIFVLVGAGNSGSMGCSSIFMPLTIFENSIVSGGTDINDNIPSWSSIGPVDVFGFQHLKPDFVSPGLLVPTSMGLTSGTSISSPITAGVIALILSANPALRGQVSEVKQILIDTAVPVFADDSCGGYSGQDIPNPFGGYGRIDALAAVDLALGTSSSSNPNENDDVIVYPNPGNNMIYIKSESTTIRKMFLRNVQGQSLNVSLTIADRYNVIETNSLETGSYYLELHTDKGVVIRKWMKL